MRKILIPASAAVILLAGGCDRGAGDRDATPIKVLVSIPPQKQFVEAVAGPEVTVHVLVPPGASPATYDPKPDDLIRVEEADIYFRIGHIGFERSHLTRLKSLNPRMAIVDTSEGIALRTFADDDPSGFESEVTHRESQIDPQASSGHDHAGDFDPHIWLSPPAVRIQLRTIERALAGIDPSRAETYRKNAETYLARLDSLHDELRALFARLSSRTLLVFHPAWGYFADAYGLKQLAIEQQGKDPSPERLRRIIDIAKANRVSVVFVQKQFSRESARSIAEQIGGSVVAIDPLAEDYIGNLRSVGRSIFEHLSGERKNP